MNVTEQDLTWTDVGAEFDRGAVVRAINAIEWRPLAGDWPMAPGLAIKDCIAELRIPKVDTAGISTVVLSNRYSVYGIEGNYRNGVARVYIIDQGHMQTPVASHLVDPVAAATHAGVLACQAGQPRIAPRELFVDGVPGSNDQALVKAWYVGWDGENLKPGTP